MYINKQANIMSILAHMYINKQADILSILICIYIYMSESATSGNSTNQ